MKHQLRALLSSIKSGEPPRLIVIAADPGKKKSAPTDAYLASESVDVICKTLLPDAEDRDLSLVRFSGTDSDFRLFKAVEEMRSGSFFASRKVVLVQRYRSGGGQAKDLQEILDFKNWDPVNTLILWADQNLPNKILKKLLNSDGAVVLDAKCPYPNEVPAIVSTMSRRCGKTIENRAVYALIELVGPTLTVLWMEISKLSDYVGERQEIQEADVLDVCGETREHDVFTLVDAIAAPDQRKALRELERLMDQQVQPLQLVALLAMQFRRLLVIRMAVDENSQVEAAAKKAGVQPWMLRKLLPTARRVPVRRSLGCLSLLARADHDLKTLRTSARIVFENCVLRMMRC